MRPLPTIDLSDVDEDVGHTLVHYLHTGTYQTLKLPGIPAIVQRLSEYKRSLRSYCVAKRYALNGLENLAKAHIDTSGKRIPFFDLLSITEELYGGVPSCDKWFVTFLENMIDAAFRTDKSLFTKGAFLNRIGDNTRYNLVLVNSIVRNLTKSSKVMTSSLGSTYGRCCCGLRCNKTEVELVMPTAAKEESPMFENYSTIEESGRSPRPRVSSTHSFGTPSSCSSEVFSCTEVPHGPAAEVSCGRAVEAPCGPPIEAALRSDRCSVEEDWVLPRDSSEKRVGLKTKKAKKTIKKKIGKDICPAPPAVLEADYALELEPVLDILPPASPIVELDLESCFVPRREEALDDENYVFRSRAKKNMCYPPPPPAPPAFGSDSEVRYVEVLPSPPEEEVLLPPKKDKKKSKKYTWGSPPPPPPPPAPVAVEFSNGVVYAPTVDVVRQNISTETVVEEATLPQVDEVFWPQKKGKKKSTYYVTPKLLQIDDFYIPQKKDKKKGKMYTSPPLSPSSPAELYSPS